ncbi:MAG: 4Fe-4S dicluster domain-containing protein [Candidatus Lokiarchaeota archaeon]|nr:4Fe-4S dicluster domain-containing protein [Candidatus Lokiarchaeota archaeon]
MTRINKEEMDAIAEASASSLFVRALLENQPAIIDAKKLNIASLNAIIDSMMIHETKKFRVLLYILTKGKASISEMEKNIEDLSEYSVMKHALALENEGWIELRDQENLIFGAKPVINEINGNLDLDLVSPWNLRSTYDPINIIVDAHLCVLCGACQAVCPVNAITIKDDKPNIDDSKCIHCGLCNYHCPRTNLPLNILKLSFLGIPEGEYFQDLNLQPYGPCRIIKSGQAADDKIKAVCQDGGMVTTFIKYLLDKNEIDGAVVAKKQKDSWDTQPAVVVNFDQLLGSSGTKYAVSPNFIALEEAKNIGLKKLAFVGTPCQVQAMRKYQVYSDVFKDVWGKIEFIIGIFCMESFPYPDVMKISEEICKTPINNVSKMDINKGKFFVYNLNKEAVEVPIKDVTSLARHACHYCVDLTNELADISCGSIGSGPGWSTVIVRSEKGEKIFNAALKENYFQVRDVPADKPFGIPLIEKLAGGKRTRNFKGVMKILEQSPPYYYNSLKNILKVE